MANSRGLTSTISTSPADQFKEHVPKAQKVSAMPEAPQTNSNAISEPEITLSPTAFWCAGEHQVCHGEQGEWRIYAMAYMSLPAGSSPSGALRRAMYAFYDAGRIYDCISASY